MRDYWDVWIPHRDRLDPGVMVACQVKDPSPLQLKLNKMTEDLLKEFYERPKSEQSTAWYQQEYDRRIRELFEKGSEKIAD